MKENSDNKINRKSAKAIAKIKSGLSAGYTPSLLAEELLNGSRTALAKAITIVESTTETDRKYASDLMKLVLPRSGKSIRIGITGVPGAGKSTFIEALGAHITGLGRKVAVLTVDPSSQSGKGSILGDKTRMEKLAGDPMAFIRPSPSSGNTGGVARNTREAIFLCESAGYEVILVETVGVGQSEVSVHSMTDALVLLAIPGAGDELQGIKRGIMEFADLLVVNKADGDRMAAARSARQDLHRALHFFRENDSGWVPKVLLCSALESTGIAEIWTELERYRLQMVTSGWYEENRKNQQLWWLRETIVRELTGSFFSDPGVSAELPDVENDLIAYRTTVPDAAGRLMGLFRKGQ